MTSGGTGQRRGVMAYLPIAEHGIIGDLHSIALVGTDGRIDWYCCPRFDSPSVFGAILDAGRGGFYRIAPATDDWVPKQLYFPETNVLITRFLTDGGVGEVQDFMPIQKGAAAHRHRLIRRVLGVRGEMRFRVDAQPRFNYGRDPHETIFHERGVLFRSAELSLALETAVPLEFGDDGACGEFTLHAGEAATFVLEQVPETYVPRFYSEGETREAFEQTVDYWRRWLGQSRYEGRWREMLHRSALTLEAHDVPADGSDRRSADDEPARAARRRPELGLPLHVDPRRGLLPLCASSPRVHGGGGGLHGLADRAIPRTEACGGRAAADHVRDRRPVESRGGGARATSRAIVARHRFGSATARRASSSSTSMAS